MSHYCKSKSAHIWLRIDLANSSATFVTKKPAVVLHSECTSGIAMHEMESSLKIRGGQEI